MRFSLIKLIIWPRDQSKSPRVISFLESGINLITGASRTGKSAIIRIVDYCLGSGTCSIPKIGPIRRSSSWYGVLIRTEEGYKLLARRDPDEKDGTDDYMLVESAVPTYPDHPVKNTTRGAIQGLLGRLARLPQANSDFYETGSGFKGRASFGDMTAFMFQPQSTVANDKVLFYEAEDAEHARKLREIFPLVLGAVDGDTLVKQHRLAEIRRILERKRREFEAITGSLEEYAGEIRGRYVNAVDLGLLQAEVATIDQADINALQQRLHDLVGTWAENRQSREVGTSQTGPRLADLRNREVSAMQEAASLKMRLIQLRELSQARQVSEGVLARERDRLSPTSWLIEKVSEPGNCPFCGSENHTSTSEFTKLRERAIAVESQWQGIALVPPMLDAEEVEIRRAQAQTESRLRQIRDERAQLEPMTTANREADEERAVFIGKLQEFLRVQRKISDDGGLAREITALEGEETDLRSQVDAEAIAQRKEDALLLISRYAQHYGRIVTLEDNDAVMKLDTRELTIRVLNERGESAWLHQIGSGANHLGYHVAMMLAMHEFFIAKPIPYVPSLLIFDQPSQTQFPDDLDEEAEREELLAVHQAFEACDSAIARTHNVLQIVVSEHAGKSAYDGIERLHVIERWRRGRKLIPWHWDAESLAMQNGQLADCAIEDIREEILIPALVQALSIADPSEILEVRVDTAVFSQAGIEFRLRVLVSVPIEGPHGVDPVVPGQKPPYSIRGSVGQDLSVSFVEISAI